PTWREYARLVELRRTDDPGLGEYEKQVEKRIAGWGFEYQYGWEADYRLHRQRIACLDLAFCPIGEDAFSICRSDLKAIEYAMGETLSICSDAEPFKEWGAPYN